ncbi:MAG: homoaconitate hydratase [Anaerolineae bacterium]|jgi:methanogen homoaconitase small subunit|nr:homoaconitate hydratase [Anaerolineae bacterium]
MNRIWLFGDDIDTDQIIPGRYSPYMTSEDNLATYAFIERRPDFALNVRPGDVIVAGKNFGCGSSREYAPRALAKCGIAAIIAPSFARIFFRNAVNIGLPLFEADLTGSVVDGQAALVDLNRAELVCEHGAIGLPQPPAFVAEIQAEGGIVAYVQRYRHFPGESDG